MNTFALLAATHYDCWHPAVATFDGEKPHWQLLWLSFNWFGDG
jgi:hypothetical protein